jgi:iron-sulfur cluster repair protein YtfE (RIC family)
MTTVITSRSSPRYSWRQEVEPMALSASRAEQIVGEVVHRHDGALEVMARSGINCCCAVQLTLAEAAAAAGAPIEAMFQALDEARAASA